MTGETDHSTEILERLQRLAEAGTAGSSPWPGVDQAMHRAHRRRMATVSTLVAAGVLAGGFVFNGLSEPNALPTPVAPAITAPPSPTITPIDVTPVKVKKNLTPAQAGYTGATGGSLSQDQAWQAALRTRVSTLIGRGEGGLSTTKADMLVLWAGDLENARYGMVLFRRTEPLKPQQKTWNTVTMVGPKGADPAVMTNSGYRVIGPGLSSAPRAEFIHDREDLTPSKGTVFVLAPGASSIEVATSRSFAPNGTVATTWRALEKPTGPVWVGRLDPAEMQLADYRVNQAPTAGFGASPDGYLWSADDGAASITAKGTDPAALKLADRQVKQLGPSLSERAVLATSRPLGGPGALATVVLRSPDGGYLVGFTEREIHPLDYVDKTGRMVPGSRSLVARVISRQPFATDDALMVAVMVPGSVLGAPARPGRHDIVLAPAGAETVRVGNASAPVRHRLALITLPNQQFPATDPPDQVQALDGKGTVIGTVTALNGLPEADPAIAHVDAIWDYAHYVPSFKGASK